MPARLIDGREFLRTMKANLRGEVAGMATFDVRPRLLGVLIGENKAAEGYLESKKGDCESIGAKADIVKYPVDGPKDGIYGPISNEPFGGGAIYHGIIIELPVPENFEPQKLIDRIPPYKDLDGLTSTNLGLLLTGKGATLNLDQLFPCTPKGIIRMLGFYEVPLEGHAVIISRSNLVGMPLQKMLLDRDMTVTVCHSKTADVGSYTCEADLVVTGVGRRFDETAPFVLDGGMIKTGAAVVDVGINYRESALWGDADQKSVADRATVLTLANPEVGSAVGRATRAVVLENLLICTKIIYEKVEAGREWREALREFYQVWLEQRKVGR